MKPLSFLFSFSFFIFFGKEKLNNDAVKIRQKSCGTINVLAKIERNIKGHLSIVSNFFFYRKLLNFHNLSFLSYESAFFLKNVKDKKLMNWCLWVSPNLLLLICSNPKPNTHVKMRAEKGPKIIDLFIGLSLKIPCDMSQKKRLQNVVFIYFFFQHLCVVTTYRYMILGHKNSFLLLLLILLGIEHSTFCDTFIT